MTTARPVVAVAVAAAVAAGASHRASAETPAECVSISPTGFCIEWSTPGDDNPGDPGSSGGGEGPTCYWVTLDHDAGTMDPTIFVDYGLPTPPDGVTVVWQAWECADGSFADQYRWIVPPTPGEIAAGVRGRI